MNQQLRLVSPQSPAPTLEAIRAPIAEDMKRVDAVIRARLSSDVVLIRQIAEYIIGAGGKRLRPALVLLAAGACGVGNVGAKHEMAAVIEFIHTATLLHDDVVDESDLRRGRKTANALFGNAASVLVGDFLYSRSFQMMVDAGSMRIMDVMANATNVIAEGEVLQLLNIGDADTSEDAYLRVISCKTAKLFESAGQVGAILGNASTTMERALAEYGMRLGMAFQLVDDLLDYFGEVAETGKNLGDDLAEGKPTLPLIHALKHADGKAQAAIREAIAGGGKGDLELIVAALRECGALDYTHQRAEQEAARAKTLLDVLPDGPYRSSLLQLADFSVLRSY